MERLCLQQSPPSVCMAEMDQRHKFKTLLNSFGSRLGCVLCNSLLFACLDKVKQIVNAKYRDAAV